MPNILFLFINLNILFNSSNFWNTTKFEDIKNGEELKRETIDEKHHTLLKFGYGYSSLKTLKEETESYIGREELPFFSISLDTLNKEKYGIRFGMGFSSFSSIKSGKEFSSSFSFLEFGITKSLLTKKYIIIYSFLCIGISATSTYLSSTSEYISSYASMLIDIGLGSVFYNILNPLIIFIEGGIWGLKANSYFLSEYISTKTYPYIQLGIGFIF